jgi:hypothetical protein
MISKIITDQLLARDGEYFFVFKKRCTLMRKVRGPRGRGNREWKVEMGRGNEKGKWEAEME